MAKFQLAKSPISAWPTKVRKVCTELVQ